MATIAESVKQTLDDPNIIALSLEYGQGRKFIQGKIVVFRFEPGIITASKKNIRGELLWESAKYRDGSILTFTVNKTPGVWGFDTSHEKAVR